MTILTIRGTCSSPCKIGDIALSSAREICCLIDQSSFTASVGRILNRVKTQGYRPSVLDLGATLSFQRIVMQIYIVSMKRTSIRRRKLMDRYYFLAVRRAQRTTQSAWGIALLDNALSCMNEYSQAVRKYVVDKFANASDFHINRPSQGSEGYSRDVMKNGKVLLVAGGPI